MKIHLLILPLAASFACGADEVPGLQQNTTLPSSPASQRYVGCIDPTSDANTFVLNVSEGRTPDRHDGHPPGVSPVAATSGTRRGGPPPTPQIVTYTLLGETTADIREYVGHTVEVVGTTSGMPHVASVKTLAEYCE